MTRWTPWPRSEKVPKLIWNISASRKGWTLNEVPDIRNKAKQFTQRYHHWSDFCATKDRIILCSLCAQIYWKTFSATISIVKVYEVWRGRRNHRTHIVFDIDWLMSSMYPGLIIEMTQPAITSIYSFVWNAQGTFRFNKWATENDRYENARLALRCVLELDVEEINQPEMKMKDRLGWRVMINCRPATKKKKKNYNLTEWCPWANIPPEIYN